LALHGDLKRDARLPAQVAFGRGDWPQLRAPNQTKEEESEVGTAGEAEESPAEIEVGGMEREDRSEKECGV